MTVGAPDPAGLHAAVQRALHAQFVPTAIEVDRPADGPATVTLLIEGTEAGVDGRTAQALGTLGPARRGDRAAGLVGTAARADGPAAAGGVLMKVTTELAGLGRLLDGVALTAAQAGLPVAVRGSAGAGVLYLGLPGDDPAAVASFVATLRGAAPAWSGSVVVLAAPAPVRARSTAGARWPGWR